MHEPMRTAAWLAAFGSMLAVGAGAEEAPFDLIEIPAPGRTASAGFADLDGDGLRDVFSIGLSGTPPAVRRVLRIHYQTPEGRFSGIPDWSGEVLAGAGAFDVADLPDGAGEEILLLVREGVLVLSFAGRVPTRREIPLPQPPTIAFAPDERGLDRLVIARDGFHDSPLLLVPALGDLTVMRPDGTLLGRLDVGHRANYLVPPRPGPLLTENEIEQFYDFPRIDVGDVDGDGRADVIACNRHEIRVFRRQAEGGFDAAPQPALAIGLLTEKDMIRSGASNVRVVPADFDGDGRMDLLMSHNAGGFLKAVTTTTIHLNRGGSWDLQQPDQRFVAKERWNAWQLVDLDGDGRVEVVEAQIRISVLEFVEVLVTRAVDAEVIVRRHDGSAKVLGNKPWSTRTLSIPISFETFEPEGFIPTFTPDLNRDGIADWMSAGGGKALEVRLGRVDDPWGKRVGRQEMDTTGTLRFGDLNADGLTDFILYDRTRAGTPLRIGRNRGVLPGTRTPTEMRAADSDGGQGH